MDIHQKTEGQIAIIKFMEPRLDIRTCQDLPLKVARLIEEGHGRIAFDLSNLDFIDSTGLATLISMMRSLGEKGKLVVFGPQKHILQLFELTRLDRLFPMAASQEEAVKALG